jgi:hypothetical protein
MLKDNAHFLKVLSLMEMVESSFFTHLMAMSLGNQRGSLLLRMKKVPTIPMFLANIPL